MRSADVAFQTSTLRSIFRGWPNVALRLADYTRWFPDEVRLLTSEFELDPFEKKDCGLVLYIYFEIP